MTTSIFSPYTSNPPALPAVKDPTPALPNVQANRQTGALSPAPAASTPQQISTLSKIAQSLGMGFIHGGAIFGTGISVVLNM